ncbi:MAG: 23S rRNA (pseudouridine(1915)-N(3))-methyltransferase RlmH [Proteobacteria bacterium]|nr:23S rRNA (pseudouridine(1915)-N(3))-methyltransferase RlmH [Pseudomonadota bacterium]
MKIRLLAVGQKMPTWVNEGYKDFATRMPPECRLDLVELPLAQRSKSRPTARAIEQEGERMLAVLSERERLVALDVRGTAWSTEQLSETLADWLAGGSDVALAIGGPDGLADSVIARAERRWSLSPLTLPHPLVRIVVAEQLYRAMSILKNHPYHRA